MSSVISCRRCPNDIYNCRENTWLVYFNTRSTGFSPIDRLKSFCCLRVLITKFLGTIPSFFTFFSPISSLCSCFCTSSTLALLTSEKPLSRKLVREMIYFVNWLIVSLQQSCTRVFISWSNNFSGSDELSNGRAELSTAMVIWSVLIEGAAACSRDDKHIWEEFVETLALSF